MLFRGRFGIDFPLAGVIIMAAPIKMDELLVSWLGSDDVYENVLNLIEKYEKEGKVSEGQENQSPNAFASNAYPSKSETPSGTGKKQPIPPFYPLKTSNGITVRRRRKLPKQFESWDPLPDGDANSRLNKTSATKTSEENSDDNAETSSIDGNSTVCVRDQILKLLQELQVVPQGGDMDGDVTIDPKFFVRITKEICHFPSFFNGPLYQRILQLWNTDHQANLTAITLSTIEWYWKKEMEPYDPAERFFRLVKQPGEDCILRDDFLPYIKALLNDHPVSRNNSNSLRKFDDATLSKVKQQNFFLIFCLFLLYCFSGS